MKTEWLEKLEQSLVKHQHISSAVFAQLATITLEGRPANRTVVFRSFEDEKLVFTTRNDAAKVSQILNNPWAELCWYFTESREQYRISGKCEVIDASSHKMQGSRENIWQTLSQPSRQMFSWPASGKFTENLEAYQNPVLERMPEQFVLIVLEPMKIDIVDLRPMPHQRHIYTLTNSTWITQRVNP